MKRSIKYYWELLCPISSATEKWKNSNKGSNLFYKGSRIRRSVFEGGNAIGKNTSVCDSSLGWGTYISFNTSLSSVQTGRYCSIGDGVQTCLDRHPIHIFVSSHPAFYADMRKAQGWSFHENRDLLFHPQRTVKAHFEVVIGHDVWIGAGVKMVGGIRIGNGAVIAAGSVVTHDVAPYSVVGGVPARLIKMRFTPEQIAFLEEYKWWNRDFNWIKANYKTLNDIDTLMQTHE